MRQHRDCRNSSGDGLDRVKRVHVTDAISYGIDLLDELLCRKNCVLLCADISLPTGVESVRTRQNNIGMVQIENREDAQKSCK